MHKCNYWAIGVRLGFESDFAFYTLCYADCEGYGWDQKNELKYVVFKDTIWYDLCVGSTGDSSVGSCEK